MNLVLFYYNLLKEKCIVDPVMTGPFFLYFLLIMLVIWLFNLIELIRDTREYFSLKRLLFFLFLIMFLFFFYFGATEVIVINTGTGSGLVFNECNFFFFYIVNGFFIVFVLSTIIFRFEFFKLEQVYLFFMFIAMFFMNFASGLILFYIGFEMISLISLILITSSNSYFARVISQPKIIMLYALTSMISSAFFIAGISIIMFTTGGLVEFADLVVFKLEGNGGVHPLLFDIGGILILLSLFFKMGIFPFCGWIVPVYESLGDRIFFLIAGFTKVPIIFIALPKLFDVIVSLHLLKIIYLMGFLTIIVGFLIGVKTRSIRAIVGSSTLVNSGLGLIFVGCTGSIYPMLVYMLIYSVTLLLLLLSLSEYRKRANEKVMVSTIDELYAYTIMRHGGSVFFSGYFFLLSSLALMGMPPFSLFFLKVALIYVLTQASLITALIILIFSVAGGIYYLRLVYIVAIRIKMSVLRPYYKAQRIEVTRAQKFLKFIILLTLIAGIFLC